MVPSLTLSEKLSVIPKLLLLPFILIFTILISPFSRALKRKKLRRLIFETTLRTIGKVTSVPQLQWLFESTPDAYITWSRRFEVETFIDDVPRTGKKLMWIGNKDAKKVVFYVHGGGFMAPMSDFMFTFWFFVQREYFTRTGEEIGVCAMEYSLYPQTFPTQLTEIVHAFSHFLSNTRATPSDVYIAGDAAGGNLVLQFISHTLHPVSGVPHSPFTATRIGGILLISPWVFVGEETSSLLQNDASDVLASSTIIKWGKCYLEGVKDSHLPYVKALSAGERWFDGIDKLTEKIFVMAGSAECFLDDSNAVYGRFCGSVLGGKPEMRLDVQQDGTHDDMIIEFGAGGKKLTCAGEKVVEWLREGRG
ncbi:alpha/beta-hydrolase [Marasmius fiardii PR-910]|nr:alpha/beta-hydrolase [Marasmius fiardii PR-910]